MIKFKSFAIADTDGLNKFIEKNPPINTKDGSGVVFRDTHMVVIYEDGTFNEKEVARSVIDFAMNDAKTNLVTKRIAITTAQDEIDTILPDITLQKSLNFSDKVDFYKKGGLSHKQSEEMAKLADELIQKKWLSEKEFERTHNTILPSLEKLAKEYK